MNKITLKELFILGKTRTIEKIYYIDSNDNEYILTNYTSNYNGVELLRISESRTYQKISHDIREIKEYIMQNNLRKVN